MQGDGNFVLYNSGRGVWHTDTWGFSGAWLALQTDGNLVVYTREGFPKWSIYTGRLDAEQCYRSSGGTGFFNNQHGRVCPLLGSQLQGLCGTTNFWSLPLFDSPRGSIVDPPCAGGSSTAWSGSLHGSGAVFGFDFVVGHSSGFTPATACTQGGMLASWYGEWKKQCAGGAMPSILGVNYRTDLPGYIGGASRCGVTARCP
jgi:hypothetical protein